MTRKQRAAALHKLATLGPSTCLVFIANGVDVPDLTLTREQRTALETHLRRQYRLWADTWLLPELHKMVPELRHMAKES